MKKLIVIITLFISTNINAQVTYEGEMRSSSKQNTFKHSLDSYVDRSLSIDIIFPRTVAFFAIIDSVHYLPVPESFNSGKQLLEFFWTGNIHNSGYCRIEVNTDNERFLVCTNSECYILEISPPKLPEHTSNRDYSFKEKTVYKFLYRDTYLIWDEDENELIYK